LPGGDHAPVEIEDAQQFEPVECHLHRRPRSHQRDDIARARRRRRHRPGVWPAQKGTPHGAGIRAGKTGGGENIAAQLPS
jgi:hypothetical protein